MLGCLGSSHRSPVPVCNLEPLCYPKYTLASQEGPLLGVQASHLQSEEEGLLFFQVLIILPVRFPKMVFSAKRGK